MKKVAINGFGSVGVILIIATLMAIGGGVWYFRSNQLGGDTLQGVQRGQPGKPEEKLEITGIKDGDIFEIGKKYTIKWNMPTELVIEKPMIRLACGHEENGKMNWYDGGVSGEIELQKGMIDWTIRSANDACWKSYELREDKTPISARMEIGRYFYKDASVSNQLAGNTIIAEEDKNTEPMPNYSDEIMTGGNGVDPTWGMYAASKSFYIVLPREVLPPKILGPITGNPPITINAPDTCRIGSTCSFSFITETKGGRGFIARLMSGTVMVAKNEGASLGNSWSVNIPPTASPGIYKITLDQFVPPTCYQYAEGETVKTGCNSDQNIILAKGEKEIIIIK